MEYKVVLKKIRHFDASCIVAAECDCQTISNDISSKIEIKIVANLKNHLEKPFSCDLW
jgi:hypothetical protein